MIKKYKKIFYFAFLSILIQQPMAESRIGSGKCPLCQDAYLGNLKSIKDKISKKYDVNESDENNVTALFSAIEGGNTKIVKLLIKHGANVNEKEAKSPPLLMAALFAHYDIVSILIKNKANVNATAKNGTSVLMAAIAGNYQEKNYKTIDLILKHDKNINHQSKDGMTALMSAGFGGYGKIAKQLLQKGADANIKDKNNKRAEDFAEESGYTKVAKFIKRHRQKQNK